VADRTIRNDWEAGIADTQNTREARLTLKQIAYNEIRNHYHPGIPPWGDGGGAAAGSKKDRSHRHHPYPP